MPNTGSGQGIPIAIPETAQTPYDIYEELEYIPNCAVSLSRYAKLVRYDEPSFWGVVYENQPRYGCGPLWSEGDRIQVEHALAIAQQMIEGYINYFLCPTWVSGTLDEEYTHDHRKIDQQDFRSTRLLTRYPRLIAPGIRATSVVSSGVSVSHGDQLATVGPLTVSFTDPNEVKVFYPGSSRQIQPSRIAISGTSLTIEIPIYRLVSPEFLNTPEGGIMYEDDSFLSTVDVVRVYNDPSVQAVLVQPGCSNNCMYGCGDCTQSACIYIRDYQIGHIDVRPATWDSGNSSWSTLRVCGGTYTKVRLNYLCGLRHLSLEAEKAIVSLAHSLLAVPPCACDYIQKMWEHDQEMPKMLTREILNCPFGKSNGAWSAYTWAKNFRSIRAEVF